MVPKNREPTTPGEVLEEEFLRPLKMTQTQLAGKMGVAVQQVNLVVRGRRAITAQTALLLSRVFDTTPEFWLHLQNAHDLWEVQHSRSARTG